MTKRPHRSADGAYHINGKKFKELFGSRQQVMNGTAFKTAGELTKSHLMMNKWGRIVSRKKHATAKKEKRLVKHGYTAKKGKFGYVKIGKKSRKNRKSKKVKGGAQDDDDDQDQVNQQDQDQDQDQVNQQDQDNDQDGGKKKKGKKAKGGSSNSDQDDDDKDDDNNQQQQGGANPTTSSPSMLSKLL